MQIKKFQWATWNPWCVLKCCLHRSLAITWADYDLVVQNLDETLNAKKHLLCPFPRFSCSEYFGERETLKFLFSQYFPQLLIWNHWILHFFGRLILWIYWILLNTTSRVCVSILELNTLLFLQQTDDYSY